MGELQEDFGRIWEDLRQDFGRRVGWIRQSRADFGKKTADTIGDFVACPGADTVANVVLPRCQTGAPGGMREAHTSI